MNSFDLNEPSFSSSKLRSPEIFLSFNEIMFFFTRAAVGVGAPYGLAEDFARSLIWVVISGFDPVKVCLPVLQSLDEGKSSIHAFQNGDISNTILSSTEDKQLSALLGGPSICDCITQQNLLSVKDHSFIIKKVDIPLLIAASLGSNNFFNWMISWKDSNGTPRNVLIGLNGTWKTSWSDFEIPEQKKPSDVKIFSVDDEFLNSEKWKNQKSYSLQNREKFLEEGVPVCGDWSKIHAYFSRVLVPSSEKSRISGAGAGLFDTD